MTNHPNRSKREASPDTVRELTLFTVNTGDLYRQKALPIIESLAKKMNKGTYDATKALKAWRYLADDGAKAYVLEFCAAGEKWHEMFSPADRDSAASEIATHYAEELTDRAADLKGHTLIVEVMQRGKIIATHRCSSALTDGEILKRFGIAGNVGVHVYPEGREHKARTIQVEPGALD